jgi:predicted O-linked N-acetylglucosamine transferase (SPINDLY family)
MLSHVGLPHFVGRTGDEYVDIAVRTAADLAGLSTLRAGLRTAMTQSANTDAAACAHDLEALFREMWVRWCSSESKNLLSAGTAS